MHALVGLVLLLITLLIGYQNQRPSHHDALSPPKPSLGLLYADIFRPFLPPWSQMANLLTPEEPQKIFALPEVVESVAPQAAELILPVSRSQPKEFEAFIKRSASRNGVEVQLVRAVIRHESGFDAAAFSPKGAIGLMQLMPDTATLMGVEDAFDPRQNIAGGVKYLKMCLNLFDQDVGLALAAYNAGPGNVEKYNGCPPFPETQRFVARVMEHCYGQDWPKKTKMTLPLTSQLTKTNTDETKLLQKFSVRPQIIRIANIEG
jgi:soluble lytic murein transglycosylase-like protein